MPDEPELIWEPGAVNDLARLRDFIEPHNPKAAANAARRIIEAANLLLNNLSMANCKLRRNWQLVEPATTSLPSECL